MRRLAWALALCCVAGCGEPLATGDYLGEPLLDLEGNIYLAESEELVPSNLSVALFWTDDITAQWLDDSTAEVSEQNAVTSSTFPARYALTLFEPPSDEILREIPDASGQLATAVILVYSDLNDDGRLTLSEEPVVGGSLEYVVAYAPEATNSLLLGGDVPAGYRVMRILPDDSACDADAPLAALRPAASRTEIDLIVGPDVRDQLPDVDCDGEVSPWLATDCGPVVVSAISTPSPAQWTQLQRAYEVCLSIGSDECSAVGRQVMAQDFRQRDAALASTYLECAGLAEPNPCIRFEAAVRRASDADRPQALAEFAACAARHQVCHQLAPYAAGPREALPTANTAVGRCLTALAGDAPTCGPTLQRARTAWATALESSVAVETCLGSDLDCTSRQVSWREQSNLAMAQYRRTAACFGSTAACATELATRDRAQTEVTRQRAALDQCIEEGREDCRTVSMGLGSAEERLESTQTAYESCLRENAGEQVCLRALEGLQTTLDGYTAINQLRVECQSF